MIVIAATVMLSLAQEYRSYSRFPAPERWVETGVSDSGIVHSVQTGSIAEKTDQQEGFTYRSARLRAEFPADHGTKIRSVSYYQVYRCDLRKLAQTYSLVTYRDHSDMDITQHERSEWLWEDFEWLPPHEQAAFDIVCNERM